MTADAMARPLDLCRDRPNGSFLGISGLGLGHGEAQNRVVLYGSGSVNEGPERPAKRTLNAEILFD